MQISNTYEQTFSLVKLLRNICFGVVVFYLLGVAQNVQANKFRFSAIGDTPYSEAEQSSLPFIFQDVRQKGMSFMIHIGDIWSGGTVCEEALYLDRKNLFRQSLIPLVVVPGDNEYTDCANIDAAQALNFFRQNLVGDDNISVGDLEIIHQANRVENVSWKYQNVRFIGINLPGDNNIQDVKESLSNDGYLFIKKTLSTDSDLQGIVLFSQATPVLYRKFYDKIEKLLSSLSLQKIPVLIIHGDTHTYTFEPFSGKANWWRLEVSKQELEWAEILFNSDDFYPFKVVNRIANTAKQ